MRKILLILPLLLLLSCATKTKIEYVDREVVKYETKVQHDTLINNMHDSIFHTIYQQGDTIYNTKYVQKIQYRDRVVEKIDTCYKDSVHILNENVVHEKKIIPNWCYYSLVCWIIILIFAIVKVYKWLR